MPEAQAICQEPEVDFTVLDRIIFDDYGGNREAMIMMMQAIQRQYRFLPEPALQYISQAIGIPLTKIYEVATFYASFSLVPKGRHIMHVCTGTACHLKGSGGLVQHVAARMGLDGGGTTPDLKFTLETVNCLGACAVSPVVVLDDRYYPKANVGQLNRLIEQIDTE